MDRSKEINSLERRATKLAWQQSMPPLSMPVYFEDDFNEIDGRLIAVWYVHSV